MAQRTRDWKVSTGEISSDVDLHFFASTKDTRELCYLYEPQSEPDDTSRPGDISLDTSIAIQPTLQVSPQSSTPAPASLPLAAASVADVPLSSGDVIRALVARKLNKEMEQVSTSKSIKTLSGGKSSQV